MSTIAQRDRPLTATEFARMPETNAYEDVLDGEYILTPTPPTVNAHAKGELFFALDNQIDGQKRGEVFLGPFCIWIDDYNVAEPDILVVAPENKPFIKERGVVGPPDLVVEIISQPSRQIDLIRKYVLYERFGVPEYWVVEPVEKWIRLHVLVNGRYVVRESPDGVIRSERFPGVEINARSVLTLPESLRHLEKPSS